MGRGEEGYTASGLLDRLVLRIVVRIDQRLLDQKATHAMAKEQDRPCLCMFSFDPDCFEKLAGFADERVAIFAVDCRCVIPVEEDPWLFDALGKVVTEPKSTIFSRWCPPRVPSMVFGVLASWVQTVHGDDATLVSRVKASVVTRHTRLSQHWERRPRLEDRFDGVANHAVSVHLTWLGRN